MQDSSFECEAKCAEHLDEVETLNVEWRERDEWDDTRKGTMYCFKSCEANKN